MRTYRLSLLLSILLLTGCFHAGSKKEPAKLPVIFDTDTNNEVDDQHALAYLLFNDSVFDIKGVTVNATFNGGDIDEHYREAVQVLKMCTGLDSIPVLKGANASFTDIKDSVSRPFFDGSDAVQFIIDQAKLADSTLTIIAVGKLTNVALAILKAPEIQSKLRVVWLGSNYPEPGEYNQDNDTVAMNYVLNQSVLFEMVTVRGGKSTGSAVVHATQTEIHEKMTGRGFKVSQPVTGRYGIAYDRFGDYSVNLFDSSGMYGNPPGRSLFDLVAVAVQKNNQWGERQTIPAPILVNNQWVERPENRRKIIVWENFKADSILSDFFLVIHASENK